MKRLFALLICLLLVTSVFIFPVSAETTDDIVISQKLIMSAMIYTILKPSLSPAFNPMAIQRPAQKRLYVYLREPLFSISVTGTFNYDGSSSEATSASGSIATHVPNATITSRSAYTSGSSAIATGSVKYVGITLQKTVTLTCDKNGNLS